jgi:F-type H+-transporting ATPase subunit epsilon
MPTIHFEFVTQDRLVYEDDVVMVVIPGADGVIGVLAKHAPLMAVVVPGEVMVRKADEPDQFFVVGGGFVEVRPDKVILAARSGESSEEIDIARAEVAKKKAEEYLSSPDRERDQEMQVAMEAQLRRSTARLQIARQRHGGKRSSRTADFSEK